MSEWAGRRSDMLDGIARITKRTPIIIIMMAVALMYVIGLGTFLAYQLQKEQAKAARAQALAECLSSHGHVGPGARVGTTSQ